MILYLIFKLACLKHSITFRRYPIRLQKTIVTRLELQMIFYWGDIREIKENNADGLMMIFYVVDQFRRQIIMPSDDWTDNFLSQLGK